MTCFLKMFLFSHKMYFQYGKMYKVDVITDVIEINVARIRYASNICTMLRSEGACFQLRKAFVSAEQEGTSVCCVARRMFGSEPKWQGVSGCLWEVDVMTWNIQGLAARNVSNKQTASSRMKW